MGYTAAHPRPAQATVVVIQMVHAVAHLTSLGRPAAPVAPIGITMKRAVGRTVSLRKRAMVEVSARVRQESVSARSRSLEYTASDVPQVTMAPPVRWLATLACHAMGMAAACLRQEPVIAATLAGSRRVDPVPPRPHPHGNQEMRVQLLRSAACTAMRSRRAAGMARVAPMGFASALTTSLAMTVATVLMNTMAAAATLTVLRTPLATVGVNAQRWMGHASARNALMALGALIVRQIDMVLVARHSASAMPLAVGMVNAIVTENASVTLATMAIAATHTAAHRRLVVVTALAAEQGRAYVLQSRALVAVAATVASQASSEMHAISTALTQRPAMGEASATIAASASALEVTSPVSTSSPMARSTAVSVLSTTTQQASATRIATQR